MTLSLLDRAIHNAARDHCDVFHLSTHGTEYGITLPDKTEVSWGNLAELFDAASFAPHALILSSWHGADHAVVSAFKDRKHRPGLILTSEGTGRTKLTFHGACVAWTMLYSALATQGITHAVLNDAVDKMNVATPHEFVYHRWDGTHYRRHPHSASADGHAHHEPHHRIEADDFR